MKGGICRVRRDLIPSNSIQSLASSRLFVKPAIEALNEPAHPSQVAPVKPRRDIRVHLDLYRVTEAVAVPFDVESYPVSPLGAVRGATYS